MEILRKIFRPSPNRVPSEDFKTDLVNTCTNEVSLENLGIVDTLDAVQVNPQGSDDILGEGGAIDFASGVAKSVIRHILDKE